MVLGAGDLCLFVSACALLWCMASGSACSGEDVEYSRQQRMDNIRTLIEAQLGSLAPPENETEIVMDDASFDVNETVVEMYRAVVNSSEQLHVPAGWHGRDSCQPSDAFFAKPVHTFLGTMVPVELPGDDYTEGTQSLSPGELHILNAYTVDVQFRLEEQFGDISRADLLLYQEPTLTGPTIEPRDYQQYVGIATVVAQTRYFMEGRNIDTFGNGYQVFDITNAVQLWLQHNIQGSNATLEVVVYCCSSPSCAKVNSQGKSPAKVQFLHSTRDQSKTPRVIVVSNNPHEGASSIRKRSTGQEGSQFCGPTEDLCCLKPLTINFKQDLRMNNVILPEMFDANYCLGNCPTISGTALLTSQRYTFLRLLGNDHPAMSLEPCCAGAVYKDLNVLMRTFNAQTKRLETQIVKLHQVEVIGCRCA